MTEPAPPLSAGTSIAPGYVVMDSLSRNRVLDVYDVWSEDRGCRCVAKTLRPDRENDRAARRRLLREGQMLIRMTHPYIVRAYEVRKRPRPMLILETLPGETLGHLLGRRRRRLSVREIAFLGSQLCSAMRYLHRHRLLHLDLKPSNIVAIEGRAKVIDLSIARRPGRMERARGTRQYMAPEQFGGAVVGESADVWGIGMVLFEAAAGRRPIERVDGEAPRQQRARPAEPIANHRRLPNRLAEAIDASLDLDPACRPTLAGLSEILVAVTQEARPQRSPGQEAKPKLRPLPVSVK